MDHYDHLFGDSLAQEENEGEIASDGEVSGDGGEDNDDGTGGAPKPIKLEAKKKTVRNPRNMLNAPKLCGPRGIIALQEHFKDFKFRGRGHEAADLDSMMRRYEHWAHRMFPKYHFDDCLATIEKLGSKKVVQMYMNKYRTGLLQQELEDAAANRSDDNADDDDDMVVDHEHRLDQPLDPLDSMLDEQIAISRGRTSLGNTSGIANLSMDTTFDTIRQEKGQQNGNGSSAALNAVQKDTQVRSPTISDDLKAKIEANRIRALEIRKARQLALSQDMNESENAEANGGNEESVPSSSIV
uniref:TIMELESS-interacting protein n=1 Tax=Anopheles atroparvus TaxID=41427 RepID=A0A182ITK5_ANOAO